MHHRKSLSIDTANCSCSEKKKVSPCANIFETQQQRPTMYRYPYMRKRYRRLLNGCLVITIPLSFVATNIFLTKLIPPFEVPHRFLGTLDTHHKDGTYHDVDNKNMLHVVTSRFMQDQPKLLALGKARLRLFETFCLPTMLNQKVNNFIWFVMTDPQLDRDLLLNLQSLLEPHPNFYLVASNAKLLTPANITTMLLARDKEHSYSSDAVEVTADQIILTGDIDMLYSRMLDSNRSLLLETRLDADDGLDSNTLSNIQQIARAMPVDRSGWQIICSNLHYEWRNNEIMVIAANHTKIRSSGVLRVVKEDICVTPGYTLVRHREVPSIEFPAWPQLGHNVVNRKWPECKLDEHDEVIAKLDTPSASSSGNATYDCWKKMGYYPSAIRSRTITSAGMSRVDTIPGKENKNLNHSDILWELLQPAFDITPERALSTSQYIKDNLESIVLDNLKGQCTFGHSCKTSSQAKLQEILIRTDQLKKAKLYNTNS
mmetsp:Transcript_27712/g.58281  ORF Transcript_27712/g.58281 Transcript_27712/m.58281 type:complete len:486 (-) Transcript_27712:40-1497(-)